MDRKPKLSNQSKKRQRMIAKRNQLLWHPDAPTFHQSAPKPDTPLRSLSPCYRCAAEATRESKVLHFDLQARKEIVYIKCTSCDTYLGPRYDSPSAILEWNRLWDEQRVEYGHNPSAYVLDLIERRPVNKQAALMTGWKNRGRRSSGGGD
jgi:hypothetical protein